MRWSFSIGRLLGSELRVHVTFFLLLAFIAAQAWSTGGAQAALTTTLFVIVLFACVVAHEYGHALMARRYGIATPDITLLPIGGLARLTRMPERPGHEIAVALAGPAVNVVIWAVLMLLGADTGIDAFTDPGAPGAFLGQLAALNLFLALFNLIPAFPMDGGRVLRAVLSMGMTRARATRYAATAGQVTAFGLGLWGVSSGNLILVLIGGFIFLAAGAEAGETEARETLHGVALRDAVITRFEPLSPQDTLDTAAQALIRTTQHEFPVLDGDGLLEGFLTKDALLRALAEGRGTARVASVMDRGVPALPLSAPLDEALDALASAPAVAATDRAGRVLGYATRESLGELLVVLRAR